MWRSVLPENKPTIKEPTTAALTWLEGVVREAACACLGKRPSARRASRAGDAQDPTSIDDNGDVQADANNDVDEPVISEFGADSSNAEDKAAGDPGIIDDIMFAVVAEFPSEVSDPEALRLHSRAIDIVSEAQLIMHGHVMDEQIFRTSVQDLFGEIHKAAADRDKEDTKQAIDD